MKTHFKKLALAAATALAFAGNASATMITVGGVTWDPGLAIDFQAGAIDMTVSVFPDPVTDPLLPHTVSGFGIIGKLNNTAESTYCASGCELTFQFSGYLDTVASPIGGDPGTAGQTFAVTLGTFKMFVDSDPDVLNHGTTIINPNDLTLANTGASGTSLVWLDMVGHAQNAAGRTGQFTFQTDGSGTNIQPTRIDFSGDLDVVGGLAAANFDNDVFPIGKIVAGVPQFGYSDLKFTFTEINPQSFNSDTGDLVNPSGTGLITGNTIPEPTSLALAGLGLLGFFGAAARRRGQRK